MMGFVYVLECQGMFKIGWSKNPKARLAVAKNFNPFPVSLVAFYSADHRVEREVHLKFWRNHVPGRGEWFKGDKEVKAWVDAIGAADEVTELEAWFKRNRGSKVRLAKEIGVTPGTVSQWQQVPVHHVSSVSAFTGFTREQLRPDVFEMSGPSKARQSEAAQ